MTMKACQSRSRKTKGARNGMGQRQADTGTGPVSEPAHSDAASAAGATGAVRTDSASSQEVTSRREQAAAA